MHRVDGTHITLRSPSAPGVDLSLDKTDGLGHTVIAGDFFGNQALFKAGSALHTASGNQQIYVRLTGSLPSTTELLLASDGSSLRAAAPPSGTGDTSASARGGGGGLGDFSFPGATTNINPTVKAYVAGSLDVGGDVSDHLERDDERDGVHGERLRRRDRGRRRRFRHQGHRQQLGVHRRGLRRRRHLRRLRHAAGRRDRASRSRPAATSRSPRRRS